MAGMAAVERLKFILSVDADGAIKQFEKVGHTAEKNLRKAETSMQRVGGQMQKFGGGMVAAGGLVAAATFQMANQFEKAALTAGRFTTATGISAEQSSRWVEVAGDMGIEAETLQGTLNKMNKIAGTTPDVFAKMGVEIARTDSGAVDANDTFLAVVDRLGAIVDPAERAAAGTALLGRGWTSMAELIAAGSSSLTASLASVNQAKVFDEAKIKKAKEYREAMDGLNDSFQELGLSVGAGAAPVIAALAEAVGGAVSAFGSLDAISGGAAGKFAAIASTGTVLVGALSVVSGSVIKMSGRFHDADGALNRFGKTAKFAGAAMAAFAVAAVAGSVLNKFTENTTGAAKAIDTFIISANKDVQGDSPAKKILDDFRTLADAAYHSRGVVDQVLPDIGQLFDKSGQHLNHLTASFDDLIKKSPESALAIVKAMKEAQVAADGGDQAMKDYLASVSLGPGQMQVFADKVAALGFEQVNFSKEAEGANNIIADQIGAAKDASDAIDDVTKSLNDEAKALLDVAKILQDQVDAQRAAADAQFALSDAQDTFAETLDGVGQALQDADGNARKIDKVYRDVASSAAAVADATTAIYEEQAVANGTTLDGVTKIDLFNQSMIDMAGVASGPARQAILDYIATTNNIPAEKATEIVAAVKEGDLAKAMRLLTDASVTRKTEIIVSANTAKANADIDAAARNRTVFLNGKWTGVDGKPVIFGPELPTRPQYGPPAPVKTKRFGQTPSDDEDGVPGFASGTTNAPPGVALVGEQGPELVMLRGGEHILTTAQTKSAMSSSSGSSDVAQRAALTEQEILTAQYEMGELSAKKYKALLQTRLGSLEKYSSEYMQTWREINSVENEISNESQNNLEFAQRFKEGLIQKHLDRIAAMYKKARDQQAADDARAAADQAVSDYGSAMNNAWKVGSDKSKKVTQEDRRGAYDDAVDAGTNAARALLDRADANAVLAGYEHGTPEWARSVRAALLDDEKNAPALVPAIDRLLTGIPKLAKGGIVTSPTVAMIGEKGPEAVVPLGAMSAIGATYNITVNTGADPNQVVAAIKRYTKNGGVL